MNEENQNVNSNPMDTQNNQMEPNIVPELNNEVTPAPEMTAPVTPEVAPEEAPTMTAPEMTAPVTPEVAPTMAAPEVVPNEPVANDSVMMGTLEEKPKKSKTGLIVVLGVLILAIGYLCFNLFVRLKPEKNVENVITGFFTTISDVLKTNNEEVTTLTTSGNVNVTAADASYALEYEFGLDVKNVIAYLAANAKDNENSLIDLMGNYKDKKLYFSFDGGKKVYYTALDDFELDTSSLTKYNNTDIANVIDVFAKGAVKDLQTDKMIKKINGLTVETTYVLDDKTSDLMTKNGLNELLNDKNSLKTINDLFGISEEGLKAIIDEYNNQDYSDNEESGKLVVTNNILTGSITKVTIGDEEEKIEVIPGKTAEIKFYESNKELFTFTYSNEKITFEMNSTETDETTTSTLKCNITMDIDEKKTVTQGTIEYIVKDTEDETSNMNIKASLTNTTQVNGEVKSLNSASAKDYSEMTSEEKTEINDILESISLYTKLLLGGLTSEEEYDYSYDEEYDYNNDNDGFYFDAEETF